MDYKCFHMKLGAEKMIYISRQGPPPPPLVAAKSKWAEDSPSPDAADADEENKL